MILFDLSIGKIKFHIDHHEIELPQDKKETVDSFWNEKVRKNPTIFNGNQFSTREIVVSDKELHVYLNKTSFKNHLWMRDQPHIMEGIVILGTGVYVYNNDFLYLVRRNNVASNTGKLATVVGSVDYDPMVADSHFSAYLKRATFHELEEEVYLSEPPKIANMKYLGMVYEETDGISRFRYTIKGSIAKTRTDENSEVIPVPWEKLKDFYFSNLSNFNKSDSTFIKYFFIERQIWKK